ncbi:hypothetical protein SDC9_94125 [bioreactor metagenome]|uniref:Uncharacterized protein n=1 Tax=bioreactor metagenome TaxID=1076179 RepID=A0A645A2K2_9ZZZZ
MQQAFNLNPTMVRQLEKHLSEFTFFFPNANDLQSPSDELINELDRFIEAIVSKSNKGQLQSLKGGSSFPEYDFGRLVLVINESEELFMQKWLGLLGLRYSQFTKQHWMRIKALSNRLANWPKLAEYNDLKPADDLASYMVQRINEFLYSPKAWSLPASDERKTGVVQKLSEKISDEINQLVFNRVKIDNHAQWILAFNYKGSGSTLQRAQEIRSIFEKVIPQPRITYDSVSGDLLDNIREIIERALALIKEEESKS